MLMLKVNSFSQPNRPVMAMGQSILMSCKEKSLWRKLTMMTKYLRECVKEGLELEMVMAANTMHMAPTTERINVI